MKRDEGRRKKIKRNKGRQRKTIDLLLFAGIEPTGTLFQTINNKCQLKKLKERKQIVLCVLN